MTTLFEAIVYVICIAGIAGGVIVTVLTVQWLLELRVMRGLRPSVHISGPDDQDLDFDRALRSLDRTSSLRDRDWDEWEASR